MTQAQRYIENVLSGSELACEYVRLAVLRHLADLERQGEEVFPYWFDERQANRVLDFFACLKHTSRKYAGKHFNLQGFLAKSDFNHIPHPYLIGGAGRLSVDPDSLGVAGFIGDGSALNEP